MKNFSQSRLFSSLLFLLIVGVIAKVTWLIIAMMFLPKSGVEHIEVSKSKTLFYRVKLANISKIPPKPKPTPIPIAKPVVVIPPSMKGIKLIALYNASDALVVTVEKSKKTEVLSKGDNIDGFILSSAGADYAIFKKDNKEFTLRLAEDKINESVIRIIKSAKIEPTPKPKQEPKKSIVKSEYGDGKIVSRSLLSSYTKDIKKVWKDIGITEHKINGTLQGFKIHFVKKGSDFEKLGLKRGDILTAVNGQELDSYKSAYSFYGEMENLEDLILNIRRNNQDMELEYEIK